METKEGKKNILNKEIEIEEGIFKVRKEQIINV